MPDYGLNSIVPEIYNGWSLNKLKVKIMSAVYLPRGTSIHDIFSFQLRCVDIIS